MSKQSRRWTLTINNPSEETLARLSTLAVSTPSISNHPWFLPISYLIWGHEVAPETGTPHLQCYLELAKKTSLTGVKKVIQIALEAQPHLEIAHGDQQQNLTYCKKDEHWFEYGTLMQSGVKKAIQRVTDMVTQGATLREVALAEPQHFLRYPAGIKELIRMRDLPEDYDEPRNFPTEVKVYLGTTGTGKSRRAHEVDKVTWTHSGDRWFDAYEGQASVLFDDFEGVESGIPFRKLLQLTDRYPNRVPVKGSFVNWRPKLIVFTTNVHPKDWYPLKDPAPLLRRISEIREFHNLM